MSSHQFGMNIRQPHHLQERGYIPIADHALIGNLRTAALVSLDGSIESYCVPNFDSPSIFARILDKDKGGHFSITPTVPFTTKQAYLPSSNVLQTKFMNDQGVVSVTDFLPRQREPSTKPLLFWLVRRIEVIRGALPLQLTCAPAFNYARDTHTTAIIPDTSVPYPAQQKALFHSADLDLDLRFVGESLVEGVPEPSVQLELLDLSGKGHKGPAVQSTLTLTEGQAVTFVLRVPPKEGAKVPAPSVQRAEELGVSLPSLIESASRLRAPDDPLLTKTLVQRLLNETNTYWNTWIRGSTYTGAWKEAVHRSALALKLLIFEPTGAVVASPTFSLPEYIGGTRNWDYRASWIRDASFILYALMRLGFTQEANAYMDFIFDRIQDKNPDGSLQIMYTIHGGKEFPEEELTHLDGHKGSRPVRMDSVYLSQKFGRPLSYDTWVGVRELVDYVVANYNRPDLSIWEVRNRMRHFTYSKIMMWVAIDRGLRLADKRSLPCPNRLKWLTARDDLYEQIMKHAWNSEKKFFAQSYEDKDVLDSAVLIMPLVFFSPASDPRFVSTLKQILKTPERGGLTSNNLVYRYDVTKTDDGVGGEEGTFCLCTLWCVEALTRAGEYDKSMLARAVAMFEDFIQYTNHVGLCTEEISASGEALGNAVQGFTHVTLISAAFNLSRVQGRAASGQPGLGN
ncbi:glycoside hydrolase family 15 protein [Gloeophyllum trabeum ATCC 11539]|uniref:Glycoside hydrolase family 15 protein n=1 Tax=Gloeophyllum trabeum (strain ATCC 11539 / FP-39264 / Madison 617) TaxID=670483 RepID=S7Q624_GLOTA|nr:glycoside hydrolase family 15 protein [Gloeophyllum trabeum ATCC 11539]EPQ54918.1 glycoside hydrolase family 15 protein [Gloeophyllum trabeum ATCC 11539]